MSELIYSLKNSENKELLNAAIEYLEVIQDFKEAQTAADNLRTKYLEKGYKSVEICTWIECKIEINSNNKYSCTIYAKAKTMHSTDYEYVRSNPINSNDIISRDYTRQRNELGQKIIDILNEAQKAREELVEFKNNILKSIVEQGSFDISGKEYSISEKPTEPEQEDE